MKVVAHRGACLLAPENSLQAFDVAAQLQADMIELDVQVSADGHVIVFHDDDLKRLTNVAEVFPIRADQPVGNFSLRELKQLRLRDHTGKITSAKIPTLDETLAWLKSQSSIQLNIELKLLPRAYQTLTESTLKAIDRFDCQDRIYISSFDHESLYMIKLARPLLKTAVLVAERMMGLANYVAKTVCANAVNPGFYLFQRNSTLPGSNYISENWLEHAIALGLDIFPWTVNDDEHLRDLMKLPVTGLITDRPDRLRELVTESVLNPGGLASDYIGLGDAAVC